MKAILRSWRVLFLAWAVLLAPHVSLVHELSHNLPQDGHRPRETDKRHHVAKVCDTCLAFAQLTAALPSRFEWVPRTHALPVAAGASDRAFISRRHGAFDARAPPATPT